MSDAAAGPGVWFPPPLLFVGGFGLGLLFHRTWPLGLLGAGAPGLRLGVGWGAVALGLLLMFSGIGTFLHARTTVFPNRPANRLVVSGPYRLTRNPMYLGLTLAYLGGTVLVNSVWPLLLLPLVLLALTRSVIRREERYLAAAFGAEYDAYRRRVRRWV